MEIAFFTQHMMVMGEFLLMDTKRSILIVSFLHLIHEKRSKGRWKRAFMNNIFLMRYGMVLATTLLYGGEVKSLDVSWNRTRTLSHLVRLLVC
jgi:hypothetical protein